MSNAYKVVVDGSNVATEGRTLPSLSQLDEAVQAFIEEHPGADVLVIVDSSFPNRIDSKDAAIFEAAYAAGEIITPPAGTTGRGDAFILKVADKLGATVFSNDSFQEFHGTYDWLFDKGRLVGGKPVPGLGWVFMPRTPVRGPKSRDAVREAKRSTARIGSPEAMRPMPIPKAPPAFLKKPADTDSQEVAAPVSGRGGRGGSGGGRGSQADLAGTGADDVRDRDGRRKKRRKRGGGGRDRDGFEAADGSDRAERSPAERADRSVAERADRSVADRADRPERDRNRNERSASQRGNTEPINGPLTFISFISAHGIGTELEGEIDNYSSHGFYVTVGEARGYVPLAGLAIPMPRSAKEVVRRGETHRFVVSSFDSARRGIELALVGTPAASEVATGTAQSSSNASDDAATVAKPKRGRKSAAAVASVESDSAAAPVTKPGRRGAKVAVDSAAAVSKATKASKSAKAVEAVKSSKPVKPEKPTKVSKVEKPAKAEKPAKVSIANKTPKLAKVEKPSKATKSLAAKLAKPAMNKPTKAVVAKPVKAAKPPKVVAKSPAKIAVAVTSKPAKSQPKSLAPAKSTKAASTAKTSSAPVPARATVALKPSVSRVAVKPTKAHAAKASSKSPTSAKPTPAKTVAIQVPSAKKSATPNPAKSSPKPAQSRAAAEPTASSKPKAKPKK